MDIMNIMQRLAEKHQWNWANEYGEPGYSGGPVVFANWNDLDLDKYPHIMAAIKDAGIELEWDDEWVVDGDSGKCYRTEANSYMWMPSIGYADGYILTPEHDVEEWIEVAKIGSNTQQMLNRYQVREKLLHEAGFERYGDTESETGWHPGQDDQPEDVIAAIKEEHGDDTDIIVYRTEASQFYSKWVCLYRVQHLAHTISSNGYSTDQQVVDALDYLRINHPAEYSDVRRRFPENIILPDDSAWFDTDEMGVDIEWSSWLADAIEDTGLVTWDDGEPYATNQSVVAIRDAEQQS